jgi:thiol-disulfide isomerase/thioredoxin
MYRYALALLVAAGMAMPACAGEFNKKISIGDAAPSFSSLEGVDGKSYSLDDFKDKDVLVIAITCNHCPVAVAYEDRIIDFAKKHGSAGSKVAFLAVNVNNFDEDKLPKMKERAKTKGFNFPYVYDPSQKIGKDLGASVTPEFFVYNKDRKLVYMGSMDDKMNDPKTNFLDAAVQSVLEGKKPEKAETRPFGCGVKYDTK